MNKIIAKNDKEFHRLVCERELFRCQACGKDYSSDFYFDENGVNKYVCAHHHKGKKAYPALRLVLSNGRCVDKDCHAKIESGLINLK